MPGKPIVGLIVGSISDLPIMKEAVGILEQFGVPYEVGVKSAHRTPDQAISYAKEARGRGLRVIIAAAGGEAAHLPGLIKSHTHIPVVGVPVQKDSVGSILGMPRGVPVNTMPAGVVGAANAALSAVEILALADEELEQRLVAYRRKLQEDVVAQDEELQRLGYGAYLDR